MSTSLQDGHVLTITATGAVAVDSVQTVGGLIGVAVTAAAAAADEYELAVKGVFGGIPRTNIALAQGAAAYWNGTAVTAITTDKFMGHVIKAYGAGTTPIEVRLAQDAIQA